MLHRTITYKDLFTDEEVVEEFYFHLSVAELMEMNVEYEGGIQKEVERMAETNDLKGLYYFFKDFILASYGERTGEDRKFFTKTQELRDRFAASEAYSALLMEIGSGADKAAEFFNAIVPKDLAEQAEKMERAQKLEESKSKFKVVSSIDEKKKEPQTISRSTFVSMAPEELATVSGRIASGDLVVLDDSDPRLVSNEPDPTAS